MVTDENWFLSIINRLDAEKVLKKAFSKGGDWGDFFWESTSMTNLVLEDGRLEKVISGQDTGAAVRVLFDDHQAFGSTNRLDVIDLTEMALLVSEAVHHGRDVTIKTMNVGQIGPLFHIKASPRGIETAEKVNYLKRADEAARAFHSSIKQVKVVYSDRTQKVVILNSNGRLSADIRESTTFFVQVVAGKNGILQVGYEPIGGAIGFELFDSHPPEDVALKAAARAVLMLDAQDAPSGTMTVVLSSEAGGTMIHEAIGHGLEADLAGEGVSVFADRIGHSVASPLITVVDDGTRPFWRGSEAVDDEGVPTRKTVLVEQGILKGYMHDQGTAIKAGVESTGNGRRESFRHQPVVRMTNTLIESGETDPDDILAETPSGLFVRKMGGGQVNTINGHFVFDVSEGYLIENGRLGAPVRGATITGDGPEILKEIDRVGTDLGMGIGTCGKDGQGVPVADAQPTLRIPRIVVGGRNR